MVVYARQPTVGPTPRESDMRRRTIIELTAAGVLTLLMSACPPQQPTMMPQPRRQPPPAAQPPPPSFPTAAREGELVLAPGFFPQPFVVLGSTSGRVLATDLGAPCQTSIAGPPDYLVTVEQPLARLAVLAQSDGPVSLMVMAEQGGFLCSDPGSTSITRAFAPGRYAIWVGTMAGANDVAYRLSFSEQKGATPEQLSASLMGAWDATGEAVALAPGFDPDPSVVQGTTNGTLAAVDLHPDCAGFIPEQPNHLLELSADLPRLRILVRHTRDTALVVTDTRGNVWCADDVDQRFPILDQPFARGRYRVFVATKIQAGSAGYSLGFSAREETTVRSLPRAP